VCVSFAGFTTHPRWRLSPSGERTNPSILGTRCVPRSRPACRANGSSVASFGFLADQAQPCGRACPSGLCALAHRTPVGILLKTEARKARANGGGSGWNTSDGRQLRQSRRLFPRRRAERSGSVPRWTSPPSSVRRSPSPDVSRRQSPETAYRSCMGLIRSAKAYDPARFDAACQRALAIGSPTRKIPNHPQVPPTTTSEVAPITTERRPTPNVENSDRGQCGRVSPCAR
jgi:hypothetical protein